MTSRERMLRAMEYRAPDRIPVFYHKSGAGLFRHGRALQDLVGKYPPDNAVAFDELPKVPDGAIRSDGTYVLETIDAWGTVWEHRVPGLQGHPQRRPINSMEDMERYRPPAPPSAFGPAFEAERAGALRLKKDFLIFDGWVQLFERIQELMPVEEAFANIALEEPVFVQLLDRITGYNEREVATILARGADVVFFGDDWASQQGPIISPEQFRRLFRPRLQPLFDMVRAAGAKVLVHCCGDMGWLFDELADMKFDCLWHQVNRYDAREMSERCRRRGISAFIHPDRQTLMPHGTPDRIREYVRGFADIYHGINGGGIFYVEIENDAPFANAEALIRAVHDFA